MGREQDWKEIEKTQLNYEQGLKDQYKGIDIVKISKENRKTIHKIKKINAKADISSKLPTDRFPAKIIEAYKNGGNPTLDGGNYTVFGQVIDGMDVVDKIAEVETDDKDKPKEDVKIEKMEVVKDYNFKK